MPEEGEPEASAVAKTAEPAHSPVDSGEFSSPDGSPTTALAPAAAPAETQQADELAGPINVLWCSGDSPGSTTQHNFEAAWTLDATEPMINGRPHFA